MPAPFSYYTNAGMDSSSPLSSPPTARYRRWVVGSCATAPLAVVRNPSCMMASVRIGSRPMVVSCRPVVDTARYDRVTWVSIADGGASLLPRVTVGYRLEPVYSWMATLHSPRSSRVPIWRYRELVLLYDMHIGISVILHGRIPLSGIHACLIDVDIPCPSY